MDHIVLQRNLLYVQLPAEGPCTNSASGIRLARSIKVHVRSRIKQPKRQDLVSIFLLQVAVDAGISRDWYQAQKQCSYATVNRGHHRRSVTALPSPVRSTCCLAAVKSIPFISVNILLAPILRSSASSIRADKSQSTKFTDYACAEAGEVPKFRNCRISARAEV